MTFKNNKYNHLTLVLLSIIYRKNIMCDTKYSNSIPVVVIGSECKCSGCKNPDCRKKTNKKRGEKKKA